MLTDDFKQQAFEKLNKASPEDMIETLKSIDSIQIKFPDELAVSSQENLT